jgi:hypothetical protein
MVYCILNKYKFIDFKPFVQANKAIIHAVLKIVSGYDVIIVVSSTKNMSLNSILFENY